ncbi:hypothetical protein F3J34_15135 [Klebsiella sp. Ap-873]|nr:hypothetical protein [Klebsiella sp. Ap-873]
MKIVIRVLLWVSGISLFDLLVCFADEHDRKYCEICIAKELNTTAVYINENCMVKGNGSFYRR